MRPQLTHQEAAKALGSTRVFGALDHPSLLSLAAISKQRAYGRGQFLWYQGDPGDRLIVVCKGLVKVVWASEEGDEIVLVTLGRYESLG